MFAPWIPRTGDYVTDTKKALCKRDEVKDLKRGRLSGMPSLPPSCVLPSPLLSVLPGIRLFP